MVEQIIKGLPWELIRRLAGGVVTPELLGAIVMTESSGQQNATRFEPKYRWLYQPERLAALMGVAVEVELNDQKTSWGLCQVMGAVAREYGFIRELPLLLRPQANLAMAVRHLHNYAKRYSDLDDVISAYNDGDGAQRDRNGGRADNDTYVHKVHYFRREIERLKL